MKNEFGVEGDVGHLGLDLLSEEVHQRGFGRHGQEELGNLRAEGVIVHQHL